ncbi:MAG: ABC transporter ATP-binding protein [Candidatus Limnocylindrales bacterium]
MSQLVNAPPIGNAAPALTAQGLVKRYGRQAALRGLDLVIDEPGLIALVGPNGAGKSTLIKAWVGLEPPSAGRVAVRGVDPWRDPAGATALIGYVPQAPALYEGFTVRDHLALALSLRRGFDRGYAEQRLRELGVPLDRRAGRLSGGQRAQVGLALALATRARVLLLDEPLASLDPLARREFLHVLVDAVRADGSTALLSSHVVTDIEQACDRLVVLGSGRKLLDASIADALELHVVGPSDACAPGGARAVGDFETADRARVRLWRLVEPGSDRQRPARLEEIVLGYLAASRSGLATAEEAA